MLNSVVLMGRLTADPELRETPSGVPVLSFSIAVDRVFGKERQTDFINIVAWRHHAEFISKYFSKGQMIAVQGSLQSRKFTDKQGNNRVSYEVVADQVHFTGSKAESAPRSQAGSDSSVGTPPHPDGGVQNSTPEKANQSFSVGDLDDFEGFEELGSDDSDLPF